MATPRFPPLPKRPVPPYIRPNERGNKAMTIALGFKCIDGIVLCSDSQITGHALKFSATKIGVLNRLTENSQWALGVTYAGDPDVMDSFYDRISERLIQDKQAEAQDAASIKEVIEESLHSVHEKSADKDNEYIDVICALSVRRPQPKTLMLVGRRTTLHEADGIAFAGAGDSSLARFLVERIHPERFDVYVDEAMLWGAYLVEQIKEFVSGCGKKTQMVVIKNGAWTDIFDSSEARLKSEKSISLAKNFQECAQELFASLLNPENTTETLHQKIDAAKKEINDFYGISN